MITLTRAIIIACEAHDGQKDKGGWSYIHHPLHVMMRIKDSGGTEDEMIVAVLHDVIEDSYWTLANLRSEGLTEFQLQAIDALTKRSGEDYEDYVGRIMNSPLAKKVKIKDIEHNMDIKRLKGGSKMVQKDFDRIAKYKRVYDRLTGTY